MNDQPNHLRSIREAAEILYAPKPRGENTDCEIDEAIKELMDDVRNRGCGPKPDVKLGPDDWYWFDSTLLAWICE